MPAVDYEQYMKWIREEINPGRKAKGLSPVSDEDAKKCYVLMEDFHAENREHQLNKALRAGEKPPFGRCISCETELGIPGGFGGTGLCGPCCTGESETLEDKFRDW